MMKLFAIYIGGTHEKALIELHDIRFMIAEKIEDTYDALRKSWWGIPKSLHIDSWGIIESVDNYDIIISDQEPTDSEHNLFFINLGGYDPQKFTELHKNIFVIGKDSGQAKLKAKKQIQHWMLPHKDYLYEIDNILNVADNLTNSKWHIHLVPTQAPKLFQFTSDYIPISKK